MGLEDPKWGWKIQSGARRFTGGKNTQRSMASMLGDSTWGWKIQYMFGSFKVKLEDSGLGWKIQRVGKKTQSGGRRFKGPWQVGWEIQSGVGRFYMGSEGSK